MISQGDLLVNPRYLLSGPYHAESVAVETALPHFAMRPEPLLSRLSEQPIKNAQIIHFTNFSFQSLSLFLQISEYNCLLIVIL